MSTYVFFNKWRFNLRILFISVLIESIRRVLSSNIFFHSLCSLNNDSREKSFLGCFTIYWNCSLLDLSCFYAFICITSSNCIFWYSLKTYNTGRKNLSIPLSPFSLPLITLSYTSNFLSNSSFKSTTITSESERCSWFSSISRRWMTWGETFISNRVRKWV